MDVSLFIYISHHILSNLPHVQRHNSINVIMKEKVHVKIEKLLFSTFFSFSLSILFLFRNLATAIRKERTTYCSIDSQSPPRERANINYWDCPYKAQKFPYIDVACGEPRVVWRRSAPLLWKRSIHKRHKRR